MLQTINNDIDTSLSSMGIKSQNLGCNSALELNKFDWRLNINAFQRLKNLSTLENNWDGYGAPKFTKLHIRKALDLYAHINFYFNSKDISFSKYFPFIAPCSDGAILFEWGGKKFLDCQLEIYVPNNLSAPFEYLKSDLNGDQENSFIEIGFSSELLEWLLKSNI